MKIRTANFLEKFVCIFLVSFMALPPSLLRGQVASTPPVVVRQVVNDGSPQRSTVTNLSLVFSTNVSITASNLVLRNLATNAPLDPTNFALAYDPSSNRATYTFPGLPGRSLPDGNYVGAILANTVADPSGQRLDGNADSRSGDPYVFDLFRHFGDWNGDRDVDFWDNYWFQKSFGKAAGDTNYDARFDFNADGIINDADLHAFQTNYFTVLAPQPGIFAALVDDNGVSRWDNVTSHPAIAGGVVNTNLVRFFQARFDSTNGAFFDVTADLAARGSFWFASNRLVEINGGPLGNGPHTLYLKTLGAQTNINATFSLSFVLDTAAPDTFITSHPPVLSPSNTALFTFTGTDTLTPPDRLAFQCRLDGGAFSNCVSPVTFVGLPDGGHTFAVRAVDEDGNLDPSPAAFTWTIDTTPPPITLALDPRDDSPPLGDFTTTNTLVRLTGLTEPNLAVTLTSLNSTNGPWHTSADPAGAFIFTNIPLSLGSNPFRADTTDLAGNPGTASLTLTNTYTAACPFPNLDGWTITTSGWGLTNLALTNPAPGSVTASGCEAVMTEGDSFLITMERTFTVPQPSTNGPLALQFTFSTPAFDRTTTNAIKDAFEAAIVDTNGNPLTYVIADSHDACFNVSDGQGPALASGITFGPSTLNPQLSTVSIDLRALFPGQSFKLIFRLINNDRDRATTLRLADLHYGPLDQPPTGQTGPANLASIVAQGTNQIDFSSLSDVSGSIQGDYGQTSFNEQTRRLDADLFLRNTGQYAVRTPLAVAVAHISDPSVRLLNADGLTPESIPYFDFTAAITNQSFSLQPLAYSLSRSLAFYNPNKVQFTYDLVILGQLNRAPVITSVPVVENIAGHPYSYGVEATDLDGDTLTYSLARSPTNMTINSDTGLIGWQTTTNNLGSHDITVRVEDGHGGSAEQRYILSVISPPPNRPPYFVSTPVTVAYVCEPQEFNLSPGFSVKRLQTLAANQYVTGVAYASDGILYVGTARTIFQVRLADNLLSVFKASGLSSSDQMVVAPTNSAFGNVLLHADWNYYNGSDCCQGTVYKTDRTTGVSTVLMTGAPNRSMGDPAGVALGTGGPFGDNLYVMDAQGASAELPLISAISPSGTIRLFAQGAPWTTASVPARIAFSTDPRFGSYLYVADSGLGVSRIWKIDTGGVIQEFTTDRPTVPFSLRFAPVGLFPDGLYVLDASGALLRINPQGSLSEFARGIPVAASPDFAFDEKGSRMFLGTSNVVYEVFPDSGQKSYEYDAYAVDPDGDVLLYSLTAAPTNMTISPSTGVVRWAPGADAIGNHNVTVLVSDGRGGTATQSYVLTVLPDPSNHPPVIISQPVTTALAGQPQVLYVANRGDNTIRRFTTNGTALDSFPAGGNLPLGIVFDTNGNLYVSLYADNVIRKFSPDGSDLGVFANTGLADPAGMVFDSSGNLYVVNYNFPSQQSFVRAFSPSGADLGVFISGFWMDYFIARDRSGNFYLDDNTSLVRGVHKFSSTGSDLGLIGIGDFPSPNYAEGMVFDGQGNLLVVDTIANVVRKFSSAGAYLGVFASTGLDAPRDIILNGNGNFLVSNSSDRTTSGNSGIREFSASGADLGNFAVAGLNHPYGMAFRPTPATSGQTYSYFVKAIDPDNDALTFSLTRMPYGMTVNPTTGQISWNPQASDLGSNNVTVRVDDGRGGFDTQSFVIDVVTPTNHPPQIVSTPVTTAFVNNLYTYDVDATDPDNDTLTYSLVTNPTNMTINATNGLIQWTPSIPVTAGLPAVPGFAVSLFASVPSAGSLAFGPTGTVFVANWDNSGPVYVHRVGPTGTPVESYGSAIGDPDTLFYDAAGTFSGTPGALLVGSGSDPGGGRILAILPDQSVTTVFGPTPGLPVDGMIFDHAGRLLLSGTGHTYFSTGGVPQLLCDGDLAAVDTVDQIYTTTFDGVTFRVQQRDPNGVLLNTNVASFADIYSGTGFRPVPSVAFGPGGAWGTNLYALFGGNLFRYDVSGSPTQIGSGFGLIAVIQFGPDGSLWVPSYDENQLIRVSPVSADVTVRVDDGRGGFDTQSFVINVTGSAPAEIHGAVFNDLNANGIWDNGQLLVTSYANSQVLQYDGTTGTFINTFASGPMVTRPDGCAFGPDGNFYVINQASNSVVRYDSRTGAFIDVFVTSGLGGLNLPHGLIFGCDGNLYVGSFAGNQVLRYDGHTGAFLGVSASGGGLLNPVSFAFGPDGNFYVGSQGNHGVLRYNGTNGDFLGVFVTPNSGGLVEPHDMIFGPDGDLYAASRLTPQGVFRYNGQTGAFIDTFIPAGSGGLSSPTALVFGPDGYLYVSSYDTDSILRYNSLTGAFIDTFVPSGSGGLDGPDFFTFSPEPALPGWVVYLDENHNGRRDPGERFAVTDGCRGAYSLSGILPGAYSVGLELPAGWIQTAPSNSSYSISLTNGQVVTGRDFGVNFSATTATNHPPVFTSTPPTNAVVGQPFRYNAAATDPDNDTLRYDLPYGLGGMVVDSATGVLVWTPTADEILSHYVLLRVQDGRGGVALQSFQVYVSGQNHPPQITSQPTGPAVVGQTWQYQVHAQDADSDPITFGLGGHPSGMIINATNGLALWTPTAADLGTQHVAVAASDGQSTTAQTFDLRVVSSATNHAPMITSAPSGSVRLGSTYLYAVQASDPDADPLNFSLTSFPPGMFLTNAQPPDANSRLLVWTPTAAQLGSSNSVALRVDDGRGAAVIQTFTVWVLSSTTNHAPQMVSIPQLAGTVGQLYSYNAQATDPDNDPLTWSLTTAPTGMSIDPALGTIRWTPTLDQLGTNQVVVRAADPYGAWATQTYPVTVRTVNLPPQITSVPPTEAATNELYTYAVEATDPENGLLLFSLTTAPTNMVIDEFTGYIEWTPLPSQIGTNNVVVRVTDDAGAFGEQSYSVVVTTNVNHYPVITSTPQQYTVVGSNYTYQVTATDADGDTLTYMLLTAPIGMTINTNSGLVLWTPSVTQTGLNQVIVLAVDSHGAGGSQSFEIAVSDGNRPPTITSHPVQVVYAGQPYRYDVQATDPDGDALAYSLTGPPGMAIDSLGRVTWQPGIPDAGTNRISITVTDTKGAWIRQDYDLAVLADTTPPFVHLNFQTNRLPVGSILDINAHPTDNNGIRSFVVTFAGVPVPLDVNGTASIPLTSSGVFDIVARATDLAGNVGQDQFTLTVYSVNTDPNGPQVSITSPTNNGIITHPLDVVGTVQDTNLVYYTLEVTPAVGGTSREIWRGTNSVTNGVLGKLDPSVLANDYYVLRLTAMDADNNLSYVELNFSVAGELKLGNFRLSFTDLSIPVNGVPIIVGRTYDSLNANDNGQMGYGWRLEFQDVKLRSSVPETLPEEQAVGIYNPYRPGSRVYITTPGGKREGFTFQPQRLSGFAGYLAFFSPAFVPDAGVTSRLAVPSNHQITLIQNDYGECLALFNGGTLAYNPEDPNMGTEYVLTTKDGLAYAINPQTSQTRLVADANGNTLTFTSDAIISSTGVRVAIGRDPQGRIISVTDPQGRSVRYQYAASGDLATVTDRETNTTQFAYSPTRPHYLQQVIDPFGRTGVRTDYDDQGHLITLTDATGNAVQLLHNPDQDMEQVVDALGHTNTFVYDDRGNVALEINALGAVTQRAYDLNNYMTMEVDPLGNTNLYTYDEMGNVLQRTDPVGKVTLNTYQSFSAPGLIAQVQGAAPFKRLKTTTDPLGNTTVNGYDGNGNLTASTDAAGNTTAYAYDSAGNQTAVTNADGSVTRFDYDGTGHLLRQTDALGNPTTYTYDGNGNQLSQTSQLTVKPGDVRTLVTSTTYDGNGRPISATDAAGNTSHTEYDALGNTRATIDALAHRTTFLYNERGQLTNTAFADGTSSSLTYDAASHRTSSTDRAGRTTYFEYDEAGRLISTTYPDDTPGDLSNNPRTHTVYDLAGRVIAQTDERTNSTWFGYDAAGRQVAVTNALGYATTSAYGDAGRKTTETDALGRTTQFMYDALGRRTESVFPDGTIKQTVYDTQGRVMAEVDQAGVTNAFGYEALGRLTSVTNALGTTNQTVTGYAYNESGNLVRQQDANGHVTRYEYETCCQRSATILPLGQRSTALYNPVNNVAAVTNFNGQVIAYDYDVNNRLAVKTLPGGAFVRYGYTPTGRRAAITNSLGVTTWTYDARDRLFSRTDPTGRGIEYAYDQAGNRTAITTFSDHASRITNQVWTFTFDALNRLETVADGGGTNRYTYDPANNLVIVQLANGTWRTNFYDALNRVTSIFHAAPTGVFSSFRYTLGPAGNRVSVQEETGRQVRYDYDSLYRLTRETVTGDPGSQNFTGAYVYDSVGNRLYFTNSLEGTTAYAYDDNDQLLTETRTGVSPISTAYTYDSNGNTLSRSNAIESAFYNWNAENRLVAATVTGTNGVPSQLAYAYDDDGIRLAASVTETGNTTATTYLVDANRPYAQVLEQWTSLNSQPSTLNTSYTYGQQLLSQNRAGVRSYYHADHLGSTRALTDQTASPTDRYAFDAYGRLLTPNSQLPTPNSYLFAGEQRDKQLGLDYLRARYLSVNTGRFYGRDEMPNQLRNPRGSNRFLYALAEPVQNSDPSGQMTLTEVATTTAILSVLSATVQQAIGTAYGGYSSPTEWTGSVALITVSKDFLSSADPLLEILTSNGFDIGVGFGAIRVESVCPQNNPSCEKVRGSGVILGADFSLGLGAGLPIRESDFSAVTPKWMGTKPAYFMGGFVLGSIGASASLGKLPLGGSSDGFISGFARGVLTGNGNANFGAYVGMDVFTGFTFMLP